MREVVVRHGHVVLVDDEDVHLFSRYSYHLSKSRGTAGYVRRLGGRLHRDILQAKSGQIVDHINGNTLDNRRANLRFVDPTGSAQNMGKKRVNSNGNPPASPFKGVSPEFRSRKNPWRAMIRTPDGRRLRIGGFKTDVEAAIAYDAAALHYHGDMARLNFPRPPEFLVPSTTT